MARKSSAAWSGRASVSCASNQARASPGLPSACSSRSWTSSRSSPSAWAAARACAQFVGFTANASKPTVGGFQLGELLGATCYLQRGDHVAQVAFHDGQQLVQGQVDAVVGEASLREVVGADAVAAVARADQAFAQGRVLGGALGTVFFMDAGGQDLECLSLVAVLAAALLAFGDDAGRDVRDAHG